MQKWLILISGLYASIPFGFASHYNDYNEGGKVYVDDQTRDSYNTHYTAHSRYNHSKHISKLNFHGKDFTFIPENRHIWYRLQVGLRTSHVYEFTVTKDKPRYFNSDNLTEQHQDFTDRPNKLVLHNVIFKVNNDGYVHLSQYQEYQNAQINFSNDRCKVVFGGGSKNAITLNTAKANSNEDLFSAIQFAAQNHTKDPNAHHEREKTKGPIYQIGWTPFRNRSQDYHKGSLTGVINYQSGVFDLYFKNMVPKITLNKEYKFTLNKGDRKK